MLVTIKLRKQQSIVYEQEEHALRVLMEKSSTRKWPGRKREEVRRTPTSRLACYTVGNIHVHSMHDSWTESECLLVVHPFCGNDWRGTESKMGRHIPIFFIFFSAARPPVQPHPPPVPLLPPPMEPHPLPPPVPMATPLMAVSVDTHTSIR